MREREAASFRTHAAGLWFPGDEGYPRRAGDLAEVDAVCAAGRRDLAAGESTSVRASWGMFYDTSHLFYNIGYQGFGQGMNIPDPAGGFDDPYLVIPGGNPYPAGSRSHDRVHVQPVQWLGDVSASYRPAR